MLTKFHYLANLAAGTLLVVPAVGLRGAQDGGSAGRALEQTIATLEELAGIEQQIAVGDLLGIDRILATTEPPIMEPRERDEFLTRLREEVSGLQMAVDGVLAAKPGTAPSPFIGSVTDSPRSGSALGSRAPGMMTTLPGTRGRSSRTVTTEAEGFSADPLREGKLLVRAKRYDEALVVLLVIRDRPEAAYWIARCMQSLDRDQEAREVLRRIVADESSGIHGTWAQHDLDFLDVKAQIEQRRRGLEESK